MLNRLDDKLDGLLGIDRGLSDLKLAYNFVEAATNDRFATILLHYFAKITSSFPHFGHPGETL